MQHIPMLIEFDDFKKILGLLNMRFLISLVFIFSVFFCCESLAQRRCPPGVTPGSVRCLPDEDVSAPSSPIIRLVGRWEKTWGAIADASNGIGGVTVGKRSKKEAESMALTACAERGGVECKISITYKNQCVAIVQPVVARANSQTTQQVAESIDKASALGMSLCTRNNGSDCKVVYSACSEPIYFDD